jgi:hypothetical protein
LGNPGIPVNVAVRRDFCGTAGGGGGGEGKVVEHLPSKLESLISNRSTAKQGERERQRQRQRNYPKGKKNQVEYNYIIMRTFVNVTVYPSTTIIQ